MMQWYCARLTPSRNTALGSGSFGNTAFFSQKYPVPHCSESNNIGDWLLQSKKCGKDQESIQSSTTHDPCYQWESNKLTVTCRHHKRELRGCPSGWVFFSDRCYKFVDDSPSIFDVADAACWKDGASLLSVNTYDEHDFISGWLSQYDILPPSKWLTSGYYENGLLIWEADNTIHQGGSYWIKKLDRQTKGRVAYSFGGTGFEGYGWTNVSDSVPINYICEILQSETSQMDMVKREEDYGYAIIDPANIPRGPEIVSQPESIIIAGSSISVYTECTSIGNPYPTFSWYRGTYANESISSETDSRYTLSGGRFTIEDPQYDDVNSYRCKATNNIGTVISKVAKIQFGYLGEFSPLPDADYNAQAFKGVRLECNTPSYYPAVRYEWSKFGTGGWVLPGHPYQFVSMAGYLYMSEVQPTDEKEYFCFVTLTAPSNYKLTTKQPPARISLGVWLRTSEDTYVSNYGPIIYTHAFPSPALRGLTLRLECIAYGTLPISYAWRRADGRSFVPGTTISDRSRVLTIVDAPLAAEGSYICTANGAGGVSDKTISIIMENYDLVKVSKGAKIRSQYNQVPHPTQDTNRKVTNSQLDTTNESQEVSPFPAAIMTRKTEPYFPYQIGNMFVDPNQQVQWRCKAVARPKAIYTWYKNGEVLQPIPGEIEVTGNILTIRAVQKERDEGMYQCGATNLHGTTFSTGRLKVVSFKPTFDKHPLPANTLAPVGGEITIPCKVEAAPFPEVSWLKNRGNLNLIPGDVNGRIGMTATFDLVLSEINYGDAGTYTCLASNINGEARNSTYVTVADTVVITDPPPLLTIVSVNRTTFLNCHSSYSNQYDVTYTWKFNGHPIDFNINTEYVLGERIGTPGLYIRNAQYKNRGVYECVAESTIHSTSRAATVKVVGPPGPPAGVYVQDLTVTSYSARLVWTVGQETDHGDAITSFDVEAETNYHPGDWQILASDIPEYITNQEAIDARKRTDQRSILVQGLIPDTGYRFRVRAINSFGRGKEASRPSVTIKTPATLPVTAPRDVSGGQGKVGTLTITWTPQDIAEQCGPEFGYNIFWKLYEDNRPNWKKGMVLDKDAKRLVIDGEEKAIYTVTIGADNYYLQYEVKVGAFNMYGDGPNSTVSLIYSAEGMPVAAPTIQDSDDVNATAAIINWIPVSDDRETMKGRVRGYTVQYFEGYDDFTPFEGFEPDFIQTKEVYGQTDQCMLIGLAPDADYYARVQVFNSAGRGPKGQWRIAKTAKFAPRAYPTHVRVYPRTEHSVRVTWRGISTTVDEEALEGYIIRVWKVQEDIRTATDHTVLKVMEASIDGLQKHTVYVLRVLGYSGGGDGALSESIYFTVLGGNVPFDPATSQICYSEGTCAGSHIQTSIAVILTLALLSTLISSCT